jgi:hypothetical protein
MKLAIEEQRQQGGEAAPVTKLRGIGHGPTADRQAGDDGRRAEAAAARPIQKPASINTTMLTMELAQAKARIADLEAKLAARKTKVARERKRSHS